MLFMPFLLALTLFAQSANCPHHWEKEDGEISPARETRSAYVIENIHDLSTYPVVPFNFEYHKPKPVRSSFASAKEFKQASYEWRSARRVEAISKVYGSKKAARLTIKTINELRITQKEVNNVHREIFPEYQDQDPTSSKIYQIINTIDSYLEVSRFRLDDHNRATPFDWPAYNHMLNFNRELIKRHLISMLDKINPPHWELIKTWKRRADGCLYFETIDEALEFERKLNSCIVSFRDTLITVAKKFAE